MKRFNSMILRSLMTLILVSSAAFAFAANEKRDVNQVTSAVTITEAIDYQITHRTEPFTTAGSIDIQNPDAAVVFVNIKPSTVISKYLSKITVNGVALTNNTNCRVSIYRHGSIVLPHSDTKNPDGTAFYPLTVYTGDNCTGEAKQYNGNGRMTNNTSFPFRSFVLKRGYMVTMANNTNGTGYSHCYIANTEDRTVQLRAELADKVGFFRIFRWQWPAKKGVSDLNGEEARSYMNASWFYTWGAGENARTDAEFVPQRHHENGIANGGEQKWAWPSFGEINGRDNTCTHVLGQNEPDNTSGGGEVNTYVSTIAFDQRGDGKGGTTTLMDVAHEFLYSGMRIGTFACCNPRTDWVTDYVNRCRQNNIRVDFVATHYYIGGQSPANCINSLKSLYTATGLPVWVTEWNNGANWTTEGGFNTDSEGWYNWQNRTGYNATDSRKNGVWLTDVLKRAENEPWLERLAVYHAVEACRELWNWGTKKPTAGGEVYAAFESDFAYKDANEYFMTWNHKSPKDLTLEFKTTTKRATLKWSSPNGKQTDSIHIERKVENEEKDFVAIKTLIAPTGTTLSYTDTILGKTGVVSYRIRHFDSDKRQRTTGEVSVTLGNAQGNEFIQYGNIIVADNKEIQVDFSTEMTEKPYVFIGPMSNNSSLFRTSVFLPSRTTKAFKYQNKPFEKQSTTNSTTLTAPSADENIDFIAIAPGNYTFGDMIIEASDTTLKSDTVDVKFKQPFPAGVTPVVIAQLAPRYASTKPMYYKVWDVTNVGFKATAFYEKDNGYNSVSSSQPLFYAAITTGTECIDEEARIQLSAGFSESPLYGAQARTRDVYFHIPRTEGETIISDTLHLENPYIIATLQTYNLPAGTMLRKKKSLSKDDGATISGWEWIRQYDANMSTGYGSASKADYAGWLTISTSPEVEDDPTGIDEVVTITSENPLEVEVINRVIYVNDHDHFDVYTISGTKTASNATQEPGIYIVRAGKKTAKIVVK